MTERKVSEGLRKVREEIVEKQKEVVQMRSIAMNAMQGCVSECSPPPLHAVKKVYCAYELLTPWDSHIGDFVSKERKMNFSSTTKAECEEYIVNFLSEWHECGGNPREYVIKEVWRIKEE